MNDQPTPEAEALADRFLAVFGPNQTPQTQAHMRFAFLTGFKQGEDHGRMQGLHALSAFSAPLRDPVPAPALDHPWRFQPQPGQRPVPATDYMTLIARAASNT
jgi:hypothetical protein